MATLTTVQTNGAVETRVQGRVFRQFAKKTPGQRISTKESRRVCVLSKRGGRELEHWGINQPCYGPGCHHTHMTRAAVKDLEKKGILKFIGEGRNVAAYVYGREWRPVVNQGWTTMQLV